MHSLRVGVIFIALALAATARAEDKAAARQAFADGSKYYDLNQFDKALDAFTRAYWNYENPVFLYNIAQCHRALRHNDEAIQFYKSYLRKSPDAPNRTQVQKIIAELEAQPKTAAPPAAVASTTPAPANPPPAAEPAPPPPTTPSTTTPSATTSAPAPAGTELTATKPASSEKPKRVKPWVWGVVAGAVVVVAGVAIGVGLGASPKDPSPSFGHVQVN